jgi:hypothetical protein
MDFAGGPLGASFAFYAGAAGLLAAASLARRAAGPSPAGRSLEGFWAPLGLGALAAAFAAAAAPDIRLGAGALLLAGLAFLAAAPQRAEWTPPGRRLGQILLVLSIAVALAGAFLSVTDAPNSVP